MESETSFSASSLQRNSVTKTIKLFRTLSKLGFSGKLKWADQSGHQWNFFLNSGRVIYATGGEHSVRRLHRNLQLFCSKIQLEPTALAAKLAGADNLDLSTCNEYTMLCSWLQNQQITQQSAQQVIQGVAQEVLFDISNASKLTYNLQKKTALPAQSVPLQIDEEQAFAATQQLWQNWQKANLGNYSPNQAPIIKKPDEIRAVTNQQLYQILIALLDGRHTLRDIAIKTNRDVFQITQALNSYIQFGWIELVDVSDYVAIAPPTPTKPPAPKAAGKQPLIACVDDSLLVCQSMEKIIKMAGYEFIGIVEPPRVIVKLLSKKPDLIFLDLVMPYTNGYEICSQLRKVSKFKDVPIIILSGNDGVLDQVRARLVGATDFVSKPVAPDVIVGVIRKYLENKVPVRP